MSGDRKEMPVPGVDELKPFGYGRPCDAFEVAAADTAQQAGLRDDEDTRAAIQAAGRVASALYADRVAAGGDAEAARDYALAASRRCIELHVGIARSDGGETGDQS